MVHSLMITTPKTFKVLQKKKLKIKKSVSQYLLDQFSTLRFSHCLKRHPKLYKFNVNEWKFLKFCFVCYVLFVNCFGFILCFVFRSFSFLLSSCFVCVYFAFAFASRSCLWPLLLFQLSFCRSRFSSLALVLGSYFCFSLFIYGFSLAFTSCFCLSLLAFGSCRVFISCFYLSFFAYGWKHTTLDQKQQMWCS